MADMSSDREFLMRSRYRSPISSAKNSPTSSYKSPSRSTYDRRDSPSVVSPVEKLHEREMSRISELYEDTKDEFRRTQKEIQEIEERQKLIMERREKDHQNELKKMGNMLEEMKDQLKFTENQLNKTRTESNNYQLELRDIDEKLKKSESLLQIRSEMLKSKQEQIIDLSDQIDSVSKEKTEALNRSTHQIYEKESKLKSSELRLSLQESKVKDQEDEIRYLSKINEKNLSRISELEEFKKEQEMNTYRAQKELNETRDQLEMVKSKRLQKLERELLVEQLKKDNARLCKLLYATGMYNEFFKFRDDNEGGISFVGDTIQVSQDSPVTFGSNNQSLAEPISEWKFWVPQDAYDLAKSFQNRYLADVRDDLFSELLIKLNNVWFKRETRKINELKAKHIEDLKDLKRMMSNKQNYEDVVNLDRIEYLKKELKKAKSPISTKYKQMEGNILDNTLLEVEHLSKELKDFQKQNSTLKKSLNHMNTTRESEQDSIFMDGAAWMGRKVVEISDRMGEKVTSLSMDYQHKLLIESGRGADSHKLLKLQSNFLEQLEKTVLNFRERLRNLFGKVLDALERGSDSASLKNSTMTFGISNDNF